MSTFVRVAAIAVALSILLPSASSAEQLTDEGARRSDIPEANEPEEPRTSLVITANRYPTSIEKVGSSVTVIDEEEIEKRNQNAVLELLKTTPGLEVAQIGGPGRTASIFIRGAESDHTLVLIDGVRSNDNTNGQFDFANLKAENIERIEVLRGAQSVLYGSEAIGGVINIITKTAEDGLNGSVSAEGGSHGTQQYKSSISWGSQTLHTATSVSYFKSDGISAAAANRGNEEDDSYENFTISNRSGVRFMEDGKADITVRYSNATTELDGFDFDIGPVDDPNSTQENDTLTASLVVTKSITESIIPTIELGFTDNDSKGVDPDTEFNNFSIDNQTQTVTTKVDLLMPWEGVVTVGHSYENRKGETKGIFDESRDVNSLFLQKQFGWNDALFLTGGLRYDDDSAFGEEVTYRTTAAYVIDQSGTRLHTSFGTGFKAPSFNELVFPNFGNPDLEAETSWGYDVGVEQELIEDKATLDVTFFHNEIDDLITFDGETFLAANIEKAKILGVESSLALELLEWLDSSWTYTYTDSENETTGGILPRRPRHRGTLQLFAQPTDELQASVSLVLVNSRRDSDRSKMDNYEVVDLAVSYALSEHIKPFLRIENLFDEDYEEVNGYGTLGFSVFAGIQGSL